MSQTLYFILARFLFYPLLPPPENEACISDVAELKRQLGLERDKLDQAQEKLSHAELLNQRLHQEISSAKTQIPIVKESLELQRGIITQIKVAQAEVSHAKYPRLGTRVQVVSAAGVKG